MHTVRRALVALFALLVLSPAAAHGAVAPGNEHTTTAYYVPTSDPTITLHADVMRPKGAPADAKLPVILSIGPYFNHSNQAATDIDPTRPAEPNSRFDDLIDQGRIFEQGYQLIYVDLPGFGASTGCNDFGGPNEQLAVKTAVEWAAAQPWSNGKVGMWGKSYDGWTQVMALANHPKGLAATVIQSPIIDGYRTLYQNGVHYDSGWYATPALYQAIDATPPTINDDPDYFAHWAAGEIVACYGLNIAQQTAFVDKDDPTGFWAKRDLVAEARKSDVAVMWSHGFLDANTKPDNFMDVWSGLQGPHRGWFGQYHHVRGNESKLVGRDGQPFIDEAMRWFAQYLKGEAGAAAGDPPVEVADSDGRWRTEAQWPPADAVARTMPLKDGSYTDDANNSAQSSPNGVGTWTFTQPMTASTRISGVPRLTVTATTAAPRAQLTALLYDVDPVAGKAKLISRSAYAIRASGPLSFDMYPEDYRVAAGHRIGLLIAGDDGDWYLGPHSKQDVAVSNGHLTLPILANPRTTFITGVKKTEAMGTLVPINVSKETIEANTVDAPDLG